MNSERKNLGAHAFSAHTYIYLYRKHMGYLKSKITLSLRPNKHESASRVCSSDPRSVCTFKYRESLPGRTFLQSSKARLFDVPTSSLCLILSVHPIRSLIDRSIEFELNRSSQVYRGVDISEGMRPRQDEEKKGIFSFLYVRLLDFCIRYPTIAAIRFRRRD